MRTLNRPMFRYGGPIKEGVMNGIREPKRNGGPMVKQAALVGNSAYPQTAGREHHRFNIFGFGTNAAKVGAGGAAQKTVGSEAKRLGLAGLANLKKIPGYFSSKINKTVPKVIRNKSGRIIGEGGESVPNFLGRDPTVRLVGGTYKIVTDPKAIGYGKKAVQMAASPTTALGAAAFTDVLPGGNPFIGQRNLLGQKYDKETGIKTEGLFGRDLPAKAELAQIEADRIAKAERDEQARLEALFKTQNPDIDTTPKKSDNELRQERIQKYRDIMDIKGMNKDAAYNSLIAASQAISGEGDFKGSLKDGSLINKIIGSTSKAYDKPKATKDAIDTLILKGEIEKDMNKDKNAIMDAYRMKQIALADKQLSGGGFAENKGVLAKTMSGQTLFDTAAAKSSPNFMGNLMTKKDLTNLMTEAKKKGDLVERDIIINTTETLIKGKGIPNGDYTVGDVLVTIVEGKVANVTR